MTAVVRQLIAEGWSIERDDLAVMSPYLTEGIKRFGEYVLDGLSEEPEAFDPHLDLPGLADAGEAA